MVLGCAVSSHIEDPLLSNVHGKIVQERFARKNEAAELHRAFNTLDRNHDGIIDADELNALFLDMGHKAKKVRSRNAVRN